MIPASPPGLVTRSISPTAAERSGKWCGAMRQVTRSNVPVAKGRVSASATTNAMLRHPRSVAVILASPIISGVRSEATTIRTLGENAAAVCPPPVAMSRRIREGSRARRDRRISRSSESTCSGLVRYRFADPANRPLVSPFVGGFIFFASSAASFPFSDCPGTITMGRTMEERKNDISRLFAGPFPALEERLLSRLPESFGRARGREDVLLVPSNELREHLLRRLAARGEGVAAGSSVVTLYDFVVRLLKHRGIFPRELPPAQASAAMLAAVREVYGTGKGDFAAISATPGFVLALSRTMSDFEEGWVGEEILREAEPRARAGGDPKANRWAEWRRLFLAVERKIAAAGGMSRRKIFQQAVAGFEQPGYPFRAILYGFYDFTRLQWTLVDALLASGILDEVYFPGIFREDGSLSPAFAYAALAWDRLCAAFERNVEYLEDPVSPAVDAVRQRLFSPPPPAATGPVPFFVLSAPHETGELRVAARKVREWLDAHPGGDVLLVSPKVAG